MDKYKFIEFGVKFDKENNKNFYMEIDRDIKFFMSIKTQTKIKQTIELLYNLIMEGIKEDKIT